VLVYRPPRVSSTVTIASPVVYFLGGYGQQPDDFARAEQLFDLLILSKQIQNMYFVFLPGDGRTTGPHFT